MRNFKRAILIAVLPTVHLCLCAYVAVSEDVWNWILLTLIDFPLPYVEMFVHKYIWARFHYVLISPWGLTIFGTLWWLCVGLALSYIVGWFQRRGRPRALNTEGE
jgi:hypothetical protein